MISYGWDNISLHPLDSKNLETVREWRNDSRVRDWCRQHNLINDIQQKAWFEKQAFDSSIEMFLIRYMGKAVGVCGLTSICYRNRRAEFSLYIAPQFQGKGYAKPALKSLFKYGMDELNLNRIWGESFISNKANKIFKSIGMDKEGVRKDFYFKNGEYIDAILWSIGSAECNWLCSEPSDLGSDKLVYTGIEEA